MTDDAERIARLTSDLAAANLRAEGLVSEIAKWKDKPAAILPRLVVCAVIIRGGNVLLERRAPSGVDGLDGMWDLPGGKVEPGETPNDAIVREIAEELSIGVRPAHPLPFLPTSTWKYADGEQRHWILAAYPCEIISGEPVETETLKWFPVAALPDDILDADRTLVNLAVQFHSENAALTTRVEGLIRDNQASAAEVVELRQRFENREAAVCPEDYSFEEVIAVLRKERDEFERKGKDLCSAYGNALVTIHDLKARVEQLSRPVSDEEIHIFYSGECEAGVSFDFLRRFQAFIMNRFNGAARSERSSQ